jgi:hypothetical protein
MTGQDRPVIVVVDDKPEQDRASLVRWEESFHLTIRHPQDVVLDDLQAADVVLVDYVIDDWPDRDEVGTVGLQPLNGLALAAVLRQQAEKNSSTPTAFVLRSGHLQKLTSGFPAKPAEHTLAAAHDLEWMISKGSENDTLGQVACLAEAVRKLPQRWPIDDPDATRSIVEEFLGIPDASWAGQAWEDIQKNHAPIHGQLDHLTQCRTFLRWMLHKILPYPCFLWDSRRVAMRLRVTHESLLKELGRVAPALDVAQYKGRLDAFLGPRWWRSGIETYLWDLTKENPEDSRQACDSLNRLTGSRLEHLNVKQPVICLDSNLEPTGEPGELDKAIRIQPDDWPAYADQAWTTRELARSDNALAALVMEQDREYLGA